MKKILYIASRDTHLTSFHIPYINWLKEKGHEVHLAYKGPRVISNVDRIWKIQFERSPFKISNLNLYRELKSIIDDNNYDLIHCHTPTVSVLTRLAARSSRRRGTKVLYTSHGFMFYKGAPVKNWIFFFPIQWLLSLISDALITVNKEDYIRIIRKKFPVKGKYMINSIGIDSRRININNYPDRDQLRDELGYKIDDIIVLYIAEFNPGKRHEFVLESFKELRMNNPNLKLQFAGGGLLLEAMRQKVREMGLKDHISFLGFTKDIAKYIKITDIGISASNREGFGLGVAEINMCGIPIVISNIRGHNEIVEDGVNGFLFDVNTKEQFISKINLLIKDDKLREEMGQIGRSMMKKYQVENTLEEMKVIYKNYL